MEKNKIIIFPGRFQPWHYGHSETLNQIKKYFPEDKVEIWILDRQKNDFYNPFSYGERIEIIRSYGINEEIKRISNLCDFLDKVYNGNYTVVTKSNLKRFLYKIVGLDTFYLPNKTISATKVKKLVLNGNYEEARNYVNKKTLEMLIKKKEEGVLEKNYSENEIKKLLYRFLFKYT